MFDKTRAENLNTISGIFFILGILIGVVGVYNEFEPFGSSPADFRLYAAFGLFGSAVGTFIFRFLAHMSIGRTINRVFESRDHD